MSGELGGGVGGHLGGVDGETGALSGSVARAASLVGGEDPQSMWCLGALRGESLAGRFTGGSARGFT